MLRRLFRVHGPWAPVDSTVVIRGATPPTVPMRRSHLRPRPQAAEPEEPEEPTDAS